jgi:hypothetical protein
MLAVFLGLVIALGGWRAAIWWVLATKELAPIGSVVLVVVAL